MATANRFIFIPVLSSSIKRTIGAGPPTATDDKTWLPLDSCWCDHQILRTSGPLVIMQMRTLLGMPLSPRRRYCCPARKLFNVHNNFGNQKLLSSKKDGTEVADALYSWQLTQSFDSSTAKQMASLYFPYDFRATLCLQTFWTCCCFCSVNTLYCAA